MTTPDYANTAALDEGELRSLFREGDGAERVWAGWRLALRLGADAAGPIGAAARESVSAGVRRHLLVVLAGLNEWELVAELTMTDADDAVRGAGLRLLIQRGDARGRSAAEAIVRAGGDDVDEVAASLVPELLRLGWAVDPSRYAAHARASVRSRFVRGCCRDSDELEPSFVSSWFTAAVALEGPELAGCLADLSRRLGWEGVFALTTGETRLRIPPRVSRELVSTAIATSDTDTIVHVIANSEAALRYPLVSHLAHTWEGDIPRALQVGLAPHASAWILQSGPDPDVAVLLGCHELLRTCRLDEFMDEESFTYWDDYVEMEHTQEEHIGDSNGSREGLTFALAGQARALTSKVQRTEFQADARGLALEIRGALPQAVADLRTRWGPLSDSPDLARAQSVLFDATSELIDALNSVV